MSLNSRNEASSAAFISQFAAARISPEEKACGKPFTGELMTKAISLFLMNYNIGYVHAIAYSPITRLPNVVLIHKA